MSKGKKGKGSVDTGTTLDDNLIKEIINDSEWQGSLIFLVPSSFSSKEHIETLIASVRDGNRKKFHVIDKEQLLQMAVDDAKLAGTSSTGGGGKKSKQGSTAPVDKLPHVQVCQQVASCLSNKDAVSPSLMAKLLKYAILKLKRSDIIERVPPQKEVVESAKPDKPKKGINSGRVSKAGKKGKDTPLPDVLPSVPIPEKTPTEMKKRGEEDIDSKYINDEPENGPDSYILVTGFTSVDVYNELGPMKLSPLALVQFTETDTPLSPQEAVPVATSQEDPGAASQEGSSTFTLDFMPKLIHSIKGDSVLQDMAILELNVSQINVEEELDSYGQQLFDILAKRIYLVLEQHSQYKMYLKCLEIQLLEYDSYGNSCDSPVDYGLYYSLLSDIPEKCCTVQLVLHSMVEQVCSKLNEESTTKKTEEYSTQKTLKDQVDSLLATLKLGEDRAEDEVELPQTLIVSALDDAAELFTTMLSPFKRMKIAAIHKQMTLLSENAKYFPLPYISEDEQSLFNMMSHFSLSDNISIPELQFALLILSLENLRIPNASNNSSQATVEDNVVCNEYLSYYSKLQSNQIRNLENFCVQQLLTKEDLLQTLQKIQQTHSSISVCYSKFCNCNVLIAHPDFESSGIYSAEVSMSAASKVGFQSYIANLSEKYGSYVEQLAALESETSYEEKDLSDSNAVINSSKKNKKLAAYDLSGRAIVGRESDHTLSTKSGIMIHTSKYTIAEGNSTVLTSIFDKGLTLKSCLLWKHGIEDSCSSDTSPQIQKGMQLPSKLLSAYVNASIQNKLSVSTSIYGPKGDGSLPYLPAKSAHLDEHTSPYSVSQSQLSGSPQKLSKKQQEQQQLLLEQQRLQEEQILMKQREAAAKQYEAELRIISENNIHQQLFATTKDGLHLHCQIIQEPELSTLELKATVLIRQSSVSFRGSRSRWLCEEKERCYLPNGKLVRFMINGTVSILCPDGTIYQTASRSQQEFFKRQIESEILDNGVSEPSSTTASGKIWLVTTPHGEQYLWRHQSKVLDCSEESVEKNACTNSEYIDAATPKKSFLSLHPLSVFKATDPVSKEVYISREDGVTLLYQPDGSLVIQYVDGTRVTTTKENKCSAKTLIECPSFATVSYDLRTGICVLDLLDGISIKCEIEGNYSILQDDHAILDLNANGKAMCSNESSHYSLTHTGLDDILNLHNKDDSQVTVSCCDEGSMPQIDSSSMAPPSGVFKPRFFTVDSSGECTELIDNSSASTLIQQSKKDLHTISAEEVIPHIGTVTTLFKSCKHSVDNSFTDQDTVPNNLRLCYKDKESIRKVFGTTRSSELADKSSSKMLTLEAVGHSKLIQYKQFLQRPPITSDVRNKVFRVMKNMRKWLECKKNETITQNHEQSSQLNQHKLQYLYEQALMCRSLQTDSPEKNRLSAFSEIKSTLSTETEVEKLQAVLREQHIPSYPFATSTMNIEEPNMKILSSRLAATPLNLTAHSGTLSGTSVSTFDDVSTSVAKSKSQTNQKVVGAPRLTKINSPLLTARNANIFQHLEVSHSEIYFGTLEEGCTYQIQCFLKNVGLNPCRFYIKQPPLITGIKVLYSPGQIAAGMSRLLTIEICAVFPTTIEQYGKSSISYTLEICSEMNTLYLPIKADVITGSTAAKETQPSKGVNRVHKNSIK